MRGPHGFSVVLAALLLGSAGLAVAAPAARTSHKRPPGMTAVEADTLLKAYAKDRADTQEWLKTSPTSYLATILRQDFDTRKSLTLGSGPGNDVRIVSQRRPTLTVVRFMVHLS